MTGAGLLLAGGRSHRFGATDKLLADLRGLPLVAHAASALAQAGLAPLIAVVASGEVAAALPGFETVRAPEPAAQGRSLAVGVAAAAAGGSTGVLVCLGDMPCLAPAHLRAVAARGRRYGRAASYDGTHLSPPAWFGAADFADLTSLTADCGARSLLVGLPAAARVAVPPAALRDVDTPEALAQLGAGSPV